MQTQSIVHNPYNNIGVDLSNSIQKDAPKLRYRNTWHCMKVTVRNDGLRGLYRGMSSPLLGIGFQKSICFGINNSVQ